MANEYSCTPVDSEDITEITCWAYGIKSQRMLHGRFHSSDTLGRNWLRCLTIMSTGELRCVGAVWSGLLLLVVVDTKNCRSVSTKILLMLRKEAKL